MDSQSVYDGSAQMYNSNLDLMAMAPTDSGILSSDFYQFYPNPGFKDENNPIQITIPSSSSHYTDLHSSFLYLKLKIVNQDGSSINKTAVAGVENFYSGLFESLEVLLNNTPINSRISSNLYPYKYYLENLLGQGELAKKSFLSNELYFPDTAQDNFSAANTGFEKRRTFTEDSKSVELIGRIIDPISSQPKYLPTGIEIKINLKKSSPAFCLVSSIPPADGTPFPYKIVYESAIFFCKRHMINPKIMSHHYKLLQSNKRFNYPLRYTDVKSFQIASGSLGVTSETLFSGPIPSFVVVGIVSAKAINGDLTKSPYSFKRNSISSISITLDGDSTSLFRQIKFADDQNLLGYQSLFSIVPVKEISNSISREDYMNGKFLVAVDLVAAHAPGRFHPQRNAQLKLDIQFNTATTESLNVICLGNFQSLLQIDKDRNIYCDNIII